jgi:hypothetical protein
LELERKKLYAKLDDLPDNELAVEGERQRAARELLERQARRLGFAYSIAGLVGFFAWLSVAIMGGYVLLGFVVPLGLLRVVLPPLAIVTAPYVLAALHRRWLVPHVGDRGEIVLRGRLHGYGVTHARDILLVRARERRRLYRCAACGMTIRERDARYIIDEHHRTSPPYCVPCYARLRGAAK